MRWIAQLHISGGRILPLIVVVLAQATASAQTAPPADSLTNSIQQMQVQIQQLQAAISELRAESAKYHAETLQLRRELQASRVQPATEEERSQAANTQPQVPESSEPHGSNLEGQIQAETEQHPPTLEDRLELLSGKVDEQYQTKVESASKYRVRLSGMVLMNLFSNRGTVDNSDIPHLVLPGTPGQSHSAFGGTLRQSMLGLEVFGPKIAGARTTGDVQFDFAGGFEQVPNGVTSGIVRLRTATLRLDWDNTSVVGGQDTLFFAPLAPTSLASFAIPALAYSGTLWSWTPQLRVEHHIQLAGDSTLNLQAGILDPLTGEPPVPPYSQQPVYPAYRVPQAGEASNQPGIGTRVSWTKHAFGQPLTVGVGGYYSRENWGFNRTVDGWAGTSDWTLPLGPKFTLSGEFYRGRAVGGLGGGIGRSVFINPAYPAGGLEPLDAMGGWSQLKFKPVNRLEFNVAAGQDSVLGYEARRFPASNYYDQLARNRGAFANFIYHPRSDLLFSMEYRRMRTSAIDWSNQTANHVNLMMGILF